MADNSFQIVARLDINKSADLIKTDIQTLENKLRSDKNARLKILAGLDISKSKNLIQSQLATITNQANAPTIKVGVDVGNQNAVQNISAGLKDVQAQAQQTQKTVNDIANVKISNKMINEINKAFQVSGKVTDEYKTKLRILLTDMQTSWNNLDESTFNNSLKQAIDLIIQNQRQIKELSKGSQEYAQVLEYIRELQSAIGAGKLQTNTQNSKVSQFYIDPSFKSELEYIVGKTGELNKLLTSLYGRRNWTYDASKGFENLRNYIDALSSYNDVYNRWNENQFGGNNHASFLIETANQINQLKSTLSSKQTQFETWLNFGDVESVNKAIEQTIANIIKLKGYGGDAENFLHWFAPVGEEANTAASRIDNLGASAQKVQNLLNGAKSHGNYFYNNEELLRSIKLFDQEENAVATLESTFKQLGATVSSVERVNENGFLKGFTVQVESAETGVEKFSYALKNIGTKEQPDFKFVLTNITAANANIEKLNKSVDKTFSDYAQKLEQFKSTNHGLLTGLSEPIKNFEDKLAGLKNGTATIDEVKNAFQALNAEAAKITANFSRQLSPTDAAIRNISKGEDTIRNLRMEIAGLNNASKEINTELEKCANLLANVKKIESEQGTTEEWSKAYKEWELSVESLTSKIKTLKSYEKDINTSISSLNALQNSNVFKNNASNSEVSKAKADIAALIAEYQKLQTQLQGDVTPEGLKAIETELSNLNSRFISTENSAKGLQTALAQTNGQDKLIQKTNLLIARIEAYRSANTKAEKTYGNLFDNMLSELRSGSLDNVGVDRVSKQFQTLRQEINLTGKAGKTFFEKIKEQAEKFSSWMSLTGLITSAWHELQKMVTNVIELDNSLLELSKVSDLTASGIKNITTEAYSLGKQVGKTGTQVIDAITNFKRAGFDMRQSVDFAEDALILTNVAEGITDTGEAATALISIMKGYGDTTSEFSQKILDSINQVSNTQAINFDDLVDGSQRLSAVAKQAGASFEQMLGILTGTNEVLQNIEKTASGEITIFTRLQGIQLPDEEDVMPIAKLQETINSATKGAANVVDQTTGELRNVYDILDDINEVWDTLDKNTQEGIAFAAAGTRQKNVFLSMMENWENVESATKSAMNSVGSSAEENEKYLDSISGKLANLESSFQSLSNTVVDSDLVKGVVDTGTGILNFLDGTIDKLGTIPTLLTAISAGMAFKNAGELQTRLPLYCCIFDYRGYTRFKITNSLIADIGSGYINHNVMMK